MKTINGIQVLERHDIEANCPSFYATQPIEGVSDRYHHVNTRDIAVQLWEQGWMPTKADERRVRDETRRGFTHHVVRFAHRDMRTTDGDRIEIVGTNSHDRASAFSLMAGVFRLVCSNGMVVQTSDFGSAKIRHVGDIGEQIRIAVDEVGSHAAKVASKVEELKVIELTPDQQGIYAAAAHQYVYGEGAQVYDWRREADVPHAPVKPQQLLTARRGADREPTLWNTFNVVQENLIKGGLRGRASTGRRTRTRAVQSLDKDIKLNQALWMLTERMAEAVKAA